MATWLRRPRFQVAWERTAEKTLDALLSIFSKIFKDEMSDFRNFIVFKAEVKLDKSST